MRHLTSLFGRLNSRSGRFQRAAQNFRVKAVAHAQTAPMAQSLVHPVGVGCAVAFFTLVIGSQTLREMWDMERAKKELGLGALAVRRRGENESALVASRKALLASDIPQTLGGSLNFTEPKLDQYDLYGETIYTAEYEVEGSQKNAKVFAELVRSLDGRYRVRAIDVSVVDPSKKSDNVEKTVSLLSKLHPNLQYRPVETDEKPSVFASDVFIGTARV